jgi:fatty acid desaturase
MHKLMQNYAQPTITAQQGRSIWLAMHDDVKAQRLIAPSLLSTLGKLSILFLLLSIALALSWFQSSWLGIAAGYLALSFLMAQFAFIGHDAGHGAISEKSALNRTLGHVSMTLVTGLAFDEWIDRHRAHHRHCQEEHNDPDMAVAHVVSLTHASLAQKGAVGKLMARHQHWFIWPLSLLFAHSQRHLSQAGVLKDLRLYWVDALVLILHFSLWFALPCFVFNVPLITALLAYLIPLFILGPHLAAIFWVNHIGMPLIKNAQDFSFFEHQVVTSRSITNHSIWNRLFGGLNYQIEHHLFPQVPSHRLGKVQAIVRKHFAHHHIAYAELTWSQAIHSIASHLRNISRLAKI